MSALAIAQNVAASVGFQPPDTLAQSADPNASLMRVLLNRGCQVLAGKRGPFGECWPELTREGVLTTVDGQEWYAVPQGFVSLIDGTMWDRQQYREAAGSLTPQEWARVKGGLVGTTALTPRYRVAFDVDGNRRAIRLDPVPAATGETLAFEYLSRYWARASEASAVALDEITADSHVPVFPRHLVELDLEWRVRKAQGLAYRTDIAEFEVERDRLFGQYVGQRDIMMGHQPTGLPVNIPEGSWS